MKLSKKLIKLAEISPKSFAKTILRRNKSLLNRLMLLEPYINKSFNEIPTKIIEKACVVSRYGCPHCQDTNCEKCLWQKISSCFKSSCCVIKFDGLRYFDVNNQNTISVRYLPNSEKILFYNTTYKTRIL